MLFSSKAQLFACVVGFTLISTGCYHAVIDTGLAPGTQTIQKEWAHSFIDGLVPPDVVTTAAACPHGVARVETQHSFLNELAAFLTLGIYTPMQITVTCAATGAMATPVASAITGSDVEIVLARAIQQSASTGEAVDIRVGE